MVVWGIEVVEELQWKGWELGKEMTRNLALKNLSLKIQKINYRPPKTKFFYTVIPQPILLSPGITFHLPIFFRPLEEKEYMDQLWFEKADDRFCVDLRAILPCHKLICPEFLKLPMCAVGGTVEAWFCLDNVGDLPTFFNWEVSNPFQIQPTTGLLEPGQTCQAKVTFHPLKTATHEMLAVCWFGDKGEQKTGIQLEAVAKCAQLVVTLKQKRPEDQDTEGCQKVLHFGSVPVGCTAERQIKLFNPSMVSAPFRIEVIPDMLIKDQAFSCHIMHGIVPPGEKKCVSLFFHPKTLDGRNVEYVSIVPAGCASHILLKVVGCCIGPAVALKHGYVNFSYVALGSSAEKFLWLENQADCPAYFQFDIDCRESVFNIRPAFGTLAGKARLALRCIFRPTHPIIYFRRVACLIHHQDPMFLDLLGTCHSDSIKPAILHPQHLTWYRTHLVRGLTLYPPDILGAMLREDKLEQDENGALMIPNEDQDLEDKPPPEYPDIPPMMEYLYDGTGDTTIFPPPVSIEPVEVDFGSCPGPEAPTPVSLCLMNHTKGKVTVVWTRRPDCPFWVSPVTCDVPPLKSTALRLHFQPPYPNCLCKAELEVFAVYKVLRSYNNIEEECTVCPSWCLTLPVQGHSYSEASEHHIPQYSLDAPKLFPAVPAGEPSCRSLLLVNKGSMLLTFNLESKRSPDIMLRPTSGLVAPGGHQIILVCTYPKGNFWTEHIFHMLFNACSQYLQEVHMQSREEPLQLDTCKNIFFKPTSVGCSSTSPLTLHNPTRLPLEFEWRVSEEHCKILAVQPTRGLIQANETITLMWIFSPLEDFKYLFRVGMWVWEAGLPPNTKPTTTTHYLLQLVGMGVTTSLSTQEQELDFGNILVNSRSCRELVLLNQSKCTLHYRLSLEQRSPELAAHQPPALHLERTEGTLPPRSQDSVGLIACPTCRAQYAWTIRYSLLSPRDKKAGKRQELCRVTLMAVYPLLSVLDVCTMGSAEGITRKHLWSLFSLNTFNSYLERDPTPLELTYKVPVRHSMSQIPPIFTPLKLDFNFGAAPLEAPPSVVLLALKNCGLVPLDWAFLFPNDQQIDLELWADQAEFSDTELHQMRALDNCLFSICPKACSLSPGQVQVVELRYNHLFIGTDRLPVLFKVSHGREILLSFIGVTVELGQKYVHFTSTSHQFVPVSIGDTLPPRQIYELYNGGSVPVTYEIQTHILSQIQEQNFDHPIFCCLNPQGEIQPGTTTPVLWIFSPIEAKTYTVDVPIHILGWNSALIRFHGVGYDPHVMGATAPFHNISSLENGSTHFRLTVPGQMILLSQSSISLGNVPVQSKCSRLLFLNNMSKKETIVFAWELEPLDFGEVSVSPSVGVIPPEESVPFVVTLKTSVHASFYSVDLVCKVYRQQLLRQHHKELQEWKEEKGRQAVEFTITDRKVERRVYCTACAPARKYKTLPPIKIQQPFTRPASWHLRIPREESSWPCPEPPVPGMLRLSLTARTHAIDSFLANFFSEFPCHFLHRELLTKKPPGEEFTEDNWVSVSKQEKVLLIDCLTIIIRGLLEDKNFHEAVDQCLVEQVPYFCQFWSEQSAKFMAKKSSLHLVPFLSLPPETWEEQKGKEPEDFKLRLRRKDLREAEERQEEEEEEQEEEEEEEEQEEEEEEVQEEEELAREELVEEQLEVKEEEEKPWIGMEPSLHPGSQESLQRLWQQQLKAIMKEEQEQDEKEAVSRLPAFTNLQEVLLENIIQNILVEASRGEVVLTSRPRVIALPPFGVTRATTPDPLPRTPSAAQRQQAEDTRQARRPTTLAPPPPPLPSPFQ